jgi:hypothetical protein
MKKANAILSRLFQFVPVLMHQTNLLVEIRRWETIPSFNCIVFYICIPICLLFLVCMVAAPYRTSFLLPFRFRSTICGEGAGLGSGIGLCPSLSPVSADHRVFPCECSLTSNTDFIGFVDRVDLGLGLSSTITNCASSFSPQNDGHFSLIMPCRKSWSGVSILILEYVR